MAESSYSDEVLIDLDEQEPDDLSMLDLIASSDEVVDKETCQFHYEKPLEYFCNSHTELCCKECLNLKHMSCLDTSFIPKISSIIQSPDYINLKVDIGRLTMDTSRQIETMASKLTVNDEYRVQALADMKQLKKYLSKQKKKVKEEVNRLHENNKGKIKTVTGKCQSTLSEANEMTAELKDIVKSGDKNQLFVLVNQYKKRATELQSQQKFDLENNVIDQFEFNVDEKIRKMETTWSSLWSISSKKRVPISKAVYLREIGVKCDDDEKECYINGIAVINGRHMVITDRDNKAIKLFDISRNILLSRHVLPSSPLDITETGKSTFAVALDKRVGHIEILNISETVQLIKTLRIDDVIIAGLCSNGENIFLACTNPGSVKIIDLSGNVLKTIQRNAGGKALFTTPRYIALSREQDVLYISDCEANTVMTLDRKNQRMAVYKNEQLEWPLGITIGCCGEVFVCSQTSQTIHQLSPTGQFIRILLEKKQNVPFNPCAIVHSDEDNTLYVSSNSVKQQLRNYIRVFQLE